MKLGYKKYIIVLSVLAVFVFSFKLQDDYVLIIPDGFPEPVMPVGNELTTSRVELGKKLFFDPIVSKDSTVSCASCHLPELAFADTNRFSFGVENRLGKRNSPSIMNIVYHKGFMRDGGMTSLEMQVLAPVQEHVELDNNVLVIVEKMKNNPEYVNLSKRAYDREPDPYVFTHAISAYERTLIKADSKYDDYHRGNKEALSKSEKRGLDLFMSKKTNCSECHSGIHFSDFSIKNNGLYQLNYADSGRMRVSLNEADRDLFKVPSLRNVAITRPYMHDGSIPTLEAVVEHYNKGGKNHKQKSELIQPLALTVVEKQDLVNFLKSLTDKEYNNY
ncbi:MAG: cytochrome c peroxidase [Vicingaceae bacterium]|nr:cytochrome c peroxidase [Vicingaceae bacterium]